MDLAVPGATGVFAAPEGVIGEGESRGDTLVLVSSSPLTEQRASAGSGGGGSGGGGDKADGKGHTRVLAFEDDLRVVELVPESEGNPFVCDAATVDLCAMAGNTIVQAHAQVSLGKKRMFGHSTNYDLRPLLIKWLRGILSLDTIPSHHHRTNEMLTK